MNSSFIQAIENKAAEVDRAIASGPILPHITAGEIREHLARKHQATIGCPLTTGLFAWIAAHAAEEAAAEGVKRITPYWRTLKAGGELNPKFPGGAAALKTRLEAEGHRVVPRGKRFVVVDFERVLFKL